VTNLKSSLKALTNCRLENKENITPKVPPRTTKHTVEVEIYRGMLDPGDHTFSVILSLGQSRTEKSAEITLEAHTIGAKLKYFSDPLIYAIDISGDYECRVSFKHSAPLPVLVKLVIQKSILNAHKVAIKDASLSTKKTSPSRELLEVSAVYEKQYLTPFNLPIEYENPQITLFEKSLLKGTYNFYVLGSGVGHIALSTGDNVILEERHSEHKLTLKVTSKKSVAVSLCGRGFIERVRIYKEKGKTADKRIGCIIPCFNAENTLRRAVLSLLNQTKPPHTIFLVDDCSTDKTLETALNIRDTLSSAVTYIEVLSNHTNIGPYASKNRVLQKYKGLYEYWTMLDADDFVLSEKIEVQLEDLSSNDNILCSYTFGNRIRKNGEILSNRGLDARRIYAGVLFKDALLDEIGYYEPVRFGADDEFFNRQKNMLGSKTIAVNKSSLYKAEVLPDSLTNKVKMSLDNTKETMSPLRASYASLFTHRKEFQQPFSCQRNTPSNIKALPPIHVHMATYPKRFEEALKTAKSIMEVCESLNAHLHICLNETPQSVPESFREAFKDKDNVHLYTPVRDLKDNGKFLNVFEGVNFWTDDDLVYPLNYFEHMLSKLLDYPKETPLCLHGYNGSETTGFKNRDLTHFNQILTEDKENTIAGTGTTCMWLTEGSQIKKDLERIPEATQTGMVDLVFGFILSAKGVKAVNVARERPLIFDQNLEGENLFTTNKAREYLLNKILSAVNLNHDVKMFSKFSDQKK
jgi:glycosyltransferase involved in cell wall biosynthesis